jgi:hypothetical protein
MQSKCGELRRSSNPLPILPEALPKHRGLSQSETLAQVRPHPSEPLPRELTVLSKTLAEVLRQLGHHLLQRLWILQQRGQLETAGLP